MSAVLYYSTFCKHCNDLLLYCSRLNITNELHFLSIDKRIKKGNQTFILLENGSEILLPSAIRCVPSLLLLQNGNRILEGDSIKDYITQKSRHGSGNNQTMMQQNGNNAQPHRDQHTRQPNNQPLEEPDAFSLADLGGSVVSDNFSFLDQTDEELSAKGSGGMRQLYNYATINHNDTIQTPPDSYSPDKVGSNSLEQLMAQRDKDVPRQQPRM